MAIGRRSYVIAIGAAIVLVGGYAGATSWYDSRLAAQDRHVLAEAKAYSARAHAVIARLPHPSGFIATTGTAPEPCGVAGDVTVCYLVAEHPEPALDEWLGALASVGHVVVEERGCELPVTTTKLRATFGATPPCHAGGTVDGVVFSLISFPEIDHKQTTAHHVILSGTSRVSFTVIEGV